MAIFQKSVSLKYLILLCSLFLIISFLGIVFVRLLLFKKRAHKLHLATYKAFLAGDLDPEHQARVAESFEKYMNKTLDPEPILMMAVLSPVIHEHYAYLTVQVSDEDRDLEGIGIIEDRLSVDGNSVNIKEHYPIYFHQEADAVGLHTFSVKIREPNETKDEHFWDLYVRTGEFPVRTTPKLVISLPEPNKVDVRIYVYDKRGNKSNSLRLLTTARFDKDLRQGERK